MEGGEPQHLNEAGPPETDGDEVAASTGGGRFYECVFCKRGFTTAQALGGHMNIHRRDRTKIRPARLSPPGPRRGEEAYHPYSREQRHIQPQVVESSSSNYVVYFASPSPSPVGSREKSELVLAGEELQLGLAGAGETKGKQREAGTDGLDLELRLGRSRSHDSSDS